uniref:Tudor domain-containing protein n=1 Tax=Meloidogyne hapla TaxID=6305 RepID=A0A1I8BTV6_MELHA
MAYCNREPSPVLRRKEKERCMELLLDEDKIHRIVLRSPAICKLANVESPNCIWFKLINHISEDLRIVRPTKLEPLLPRRSKKTEIDIDNPDEVTLNSPVTSSTALPSSNGLNNTTTTETPDGVLVPEEETLQPQKHSIQLYDYVLAPLEANVYARARIIHLEKILCQNDKDKQFERLFAYVHFIDEGFGVWLNAKCLAKMDPNMYTHPWQTFAVSMFRVRLVHGLNGLIFN